ncbi:MAG: T9SS type A sorting domain-containing protein [Ignavibacteriae bacterium]|nr:T9SS type A sorting domain-containing protein [Ignavibacteriota bacterium]
MTLDLWEKWDFSEWISTQRFTYVFDSNENMTLGLYEYWDGINWVPLSGDGDIDFYDSFGRYYSFWCNEVKVYYSTITDVDNIFISSTNYSLSQNYPNPFNPTTTISYSIPELSNITLKVFDVLGKEIITLVSEQKLKGNYKIEFNASQLPSGTYFYRLQSGNFLETKKLILVK